MTFFVCHLGVKAKKWLTTVLSLTKLLVELRPNYSVNTHFLCNRLPRSATFWLFFAMHGLPYHSIFYGTSHTNLLSAGLEPGMYPQNKGGTTKKYRHMYGCLTTFVTQIATGMGKLAGSPITTENTGLESYGLWYMGKFNTIACMYTEKLHLINATWILWELGMWSLICIYIIWVKYSRIYLFGEILNPSQLDIDGFPEPQKLIFQELSTLSFWTL